MAKGVVDVGEDTDIIKHIIIIKKKKKKQQSNILL